ncbi:MAG: hypothetical protein HPY50_16480 [Firmicutes bacterium]|nr:hypothetical protein [Bacillota bacterium]
MSRFKRVESVTGILLFLFNVFLLEQGITAVPLRKIFKLMEPFRKNETAIRMGLSRGVKNGLLVNYKQDQEVYYRITEEVIEGFNYWQSRLSSFRDRVREQVADWDGFWSMVVINQAPEIERTVDFTDALLQLGYGRMSNRYLWLCPFERGDLVKALAVRFGINKSVLSFQSRLTEPGTADMLAAEIWPIRGLSERYREYLSKLEEAASAVDFNSSAADFLPFLHTQGFELFEINEDDPQLPLSLLPGDWPGVKASKMFFELRERMLPLAGDYIREIIKNG